MVHSCSGPRSDVSARTEGADGASQSSVSSLWVDDKPPTFIIQNNANGAIYKITTNMEVHFLAPRLVRLHAAGRQSSVASAKQ